MFGVGVCYKGGIVKQFPIFLGVVVILLLNVMELLNVGEELIWIDHVWSSKESMY